MTQHISPLAEEDRLAAQSSKGRVGPGKHGDFTRTMVGHPGREYFPDLGRHTNEMAAVDGPSCISVPDVGITACGRTFDHRPHGGPTATRDASCDGRLR